MLSKEDIRKLIEDYIDGIEMTKIPEEAIRRIRSILNNFYATKIEPFTNG